MIAHRVRCLSRCLYPKTKSCSYHLSSTSSKETTNETRYSSCRDVHCKNHVNSIGFYPIKKCIRATLLHTTNEAISAIFTLDSWMCTFSCDVIESSWWGKVRQVRSTVGGFVTKMCRCDREQNHNSKSDGGLPGSNIADRDDNGHLRLCCNLRSWLVMRGSRTLRMRWVTGHKSFQYMDRSLQTVVL